MCKDYHPPDVIDQLLDFSGYRPLHSGQKEVFNNFTFYFARLSDTVNKTAYRNPLHNAMNKDKMSPTKIIPASWQGIAKSFQTQP
jgi:hypothetical protein